MARYEVTKHLKAVYQVDAETPEAALEVPWPREDPDAVSILRERARDLDRKPAAGPKVIHDRTMRAGRTFERTFDGTIHQAVVLPGGRIKLDGLEVFKNLAQATAAIRPGVSLNAWAWWREVEPAAPAPTKPSKKPTKAEPVTAKKVDPADLRASLPAEDAATLAKMENGEPESAEEQEGQA